MTELFPAFWLYSLIFSLVVGSVLVFTDRPWKKATPTLVTLGIVFLLGTDLYLAFHRFQAVERPVLGWIWPKDEAGSLRIGYAPDSFTFAITFVLGLGLLFRAWARPYSRLGGAAALFAMGGVSLAWSSKTIWLSLGGSCLSILSAGLLLVGAASTESGTALAHQFLKRNVLGLMSALIGACGLLSLGVSLDYSSAEGWTSHVAEARFIASLVLLTAGLFAQVVPVTSLSGLLRGSSLPGADFPLFAFWVPALSAMSVFVRLSGGFRSVDFTVGIGVAAAIALIALVGASFFVSGAKRGFDCWAAVAPTVGLLGWAFGSEWIACMLLVSGLIQTLVIGHSYELPRGGWSRAVVWMVLLWGAGFFGSVTAGAYLQLWETLASRTALLVLASLAVFVFSFSSFRQAVQYGREGASGPRPLGIAMALQAFVLLLLGVFWVGRISGGALPDGVDEVAALQAMPWADRFSEFNASADPSVFVLASLVHWGGFALALVLAGLSLRTGKEWFQDPARAFPGIDRFFKSGLGGDPIAQLGTRFFQRLSVSVVHWTETKVGQDWIPRAAAAFARGASWAGIRSETAADVLTSSRISKAIDAPAKLVQWVQSGDLQWYLVFALISIAVVLAHFLKF